MSRIWFVQNSVKKIPTQWSDPTVLLKRHEVCEQVLTLLNYW